MKKEVEKDDGGVWVRYSNQSCSTPVGQSEGEV